MKEYCLGIDVGGTQIKLGLFRKNGELLDKWKIDTDKSEGGSKILPSIYDAITTELAAKGINENEVLGVGLGIPGPVTEEGMVVKCANLGWGIFNVNEEFERISGFKTAAVNDANAAALGEVWMGGGHGADDIVFVTLGTGVGGGIVIDGRVRNGCYGGAGEIGHMIVENDEQDICGCGGHGHLEQYASATGIVRMARKRLAQDDAPSKLRELVTITAKDVFDAAKNGDIVAYELVDKMCRYLAQALANIACVVDPEVFVIGGGVSKAGEIITDLVSKHYNENLILVLKDKPFRLAELGNDAGIYGAARHLITSNESQ